MTAAAPRPTQLRTTIPEQLVELAGPELLDALGAALPAMKSQLRALLEIGCVRTDGLPDRTTLDPDLVDDVGELEAAIAAAELAVLKATTPWDDLGSEDQAAILARFPAPPADPAT